MNNTHILSAIAGTGALIATSATAFPVQVESVEGNTVIATIPEFDREVILSTEEFFVEDFLALQQSEADANPDVLAYLDSDDFYNPDPALSAIA